MINQINTQNKIVDLMKQKYGLTHINKTITVTPDDTLYTLYRKTARYLYKNGVENGDYTDKDEVLALSHKLGIEENEIKKVDSSELAPEEKKEFEKKFKFKNTQKDKWEDHIYQYQKDGEKTFIFIKPNGSISSTYYGQRRYWTDTNENIKQRASLNAYYNGLPDTDATPWATRANNRKEKVFFTAYSRDLLIGYDKLNIDLKRNFKEKTLEPLNELIDNLTNPKNSGNSNEYLFSANAHYEVFAKQAHTPTYDEWQNAPEESLLKIRINKEDIEKTPKQKSTIEKELSKYLITEDQIISKTTVSNVLSKNRTLNFVNRYLKDTYNLTLQQQYDTEQARSSHATFFQTKKNIDKTTQTEMDRLTSVLSKHFEKVEIDNDVDLKELKKFIPELEQTVSALPHTRNGIKPILRFRKLKNHKALGMFTPINNTLAVDFRYDKDTKETGLQSFVHEYGHFLDYNYNGRGNLPLSINKNFSDSLQSTQPEIDSSSTAITPKESTYLKTPSEVFARAFETYASNLGLNNSVIKDKEIYNNQLDIKYSTFTPDIKKKIFSYFDEQFPNMKQQIQQLQQEKDLSKAEMHRQAFLISRGRMKPTQDAEIMQLSKEFEKKWVKRRGEINKKQLARKHALKSRGLER